MEERSPSVAARREAGPVAEAERAEVELGPTNAGDGRVEKEKVVRFRNHQGQLYVWPFALCRSFEAIKPLLEEVYVLLDDQDHVDEIKDGKYDIQTEDGATILPTLWSTFVKPGQLIQIYFRSQQPPRRTSYTRNVSVHRDRRDMTSESSFHSRDRYARERDTEIDRLKHVEIQEFTVDIGGSRQPSASDGSLNQTDNSEDEEEEEEEEEEEVPQEPDLSSPPRVVVPPVDADGNKLSFSKDTSIPKKWLNSVDHARKDDATLNQPNALVEGPEPCLDTRRITKAMVVEQETRSTIQIYTLPGPEHARLRENVRITWYHIPAERLDYNRFKNVCLTIAGLSERRQKLTRALLKRVERDKVKAFLGGLFIEPGTVMRIDEQGQPDPESVIFSCVPYFDLGRTSTKLSTGPGNRVFPARTLMESYYPYEPVRDRDAEQAYRKFGDDRSDRLIQVPTLWMLNIASDIIVTCGHRPLAEDMTKSMTIVQEDLKQLDPKADTKLGLINVRLAYFDGRVILFPLDTCRSYFQLQVKVNELRYSTSEREEVGSLRVEQATNLGPKPVTSRDWSRLVRQADNLFIDLVVKNDKREVNSNTFLGEGNTASLAGFSAGLVPPFFHWPRENRITNITNTPNIDTSELKKPIDCLEKVEKSMLSETLPDWETTNAVDRTFTSTTFFQTLPKNTWENLQAGSVDVSHADISAARTVSSLHHDIVHAQCLDINKHTATFIEVVHATLALFVVDVNETTLLRKVWGAMGNIRERVSTIEQRGPVQSESNTDRAWFVRSTLPKTVVPTTKSEETFRRSIRRCRRCKDKTPYESSEAALEHLRRHLRSVSQQSQDDSAAPPGPEATRSADLEGWLVNHTQRKREETNAGAVAILKQACETASSLLSEARGLVEGVQNEDGTMSELYALPSQLVEAFRRIVIFYLSVERALHFTEEAYHKDALPEAQYQGDSPFDDQGLEVLKRFGRDAQKSLRISQYQLCFMARSDPPIDTLTHLSLGPEYMCAWLMRRLIVKPLDKRMTVGDMYREYLSTIQFQVNHRPGKRLLREINLLQEEINILLEVNTWQTKLAENYLRVLDDASYEQDMLSRRAMFPYERMLLRSCLDNLSLASEEYAELIRRCRPLSDRTKQSLEINEEDHGKAIMVFTIVTVIFLPLSFVTSYLGMNTTDIRDMGSNQSLFYIIAVPLTVVTVGACLLIGYNGDELRDVISAIYRTITGKEDQRVSSRGISVAQRERARQPQSDANSTLDYNSLADEAEFSSPRPDWHRSYEMGRLPPPYYQEVYTNDVEAMPVTVEFEEPHVGFKTQTYSSAMPKVEKATPRMERLYRPPEPRASYTRFHNSYEADPWSASRPTDPHYEPEDYWYTRRNPRRPGNVDFHPPPPAVKVRPAEVYEGDENDGGYTWQKKRSQRHSHRGRRV